MYVWFVIKTPEINAVIKAEWSINSTGQTSSLHLEEHKWTYTYHLLQNSKPNKAKSSKLNPTHWFWSKKNGDYTWIH